MCQVGPFTLLEDPITEETNKNAINEKPKEDPYHCKT